MIRSMTGYGRAEAAGTRLTLSVECKSVNHRHLDVAVKLPRSLGSLEPDARRMIQAALGRGHVEVSVSLSPVEGGTLTPISVNVTLAREYLRAGQSLADELAVGGEPGRQWQPSLDWLVAQPGVLSREAEPALSPEEAWPLLADALGRSLADLVARREAEGQALCQELTLLHDGLRGHADVMAARGPSAVARRAVRLRERIDALRGDAAVDEARIATEVAVWSDKTDVSEELARLHAHSDQLTLLLQTGGIVGRTLDFLLQEMNREVNTVGSKADDLEISQAVIAAKGVLEKLREQVQNIE
jgi:uncharacterized protein (TIGR00255 family)